MLEQWYVSRKTVSWMQAGGIGVSLGQSCWIPQWEALLAQKGYNNYFKIFRDATAIEVSVSPATYPQFGVLDGRSLYACLPRPGYAGSWAFPVDDFTLQADPTYDTPLVPYRIDNLVASQKSLPYIDRRYGVVVQAYENAQSVGVFDAGDLSLIRDIAVPYQYSYVKLRHVSDERIALIQEYTSMSGLTKLVIFNWRTGTVDLDTAIDAYTYVEFDFDHQCFVALCRDGKSRVYGLDLSATGLSAPAFVTPGSVYGLSARQVQTRLTGSGGAGIPGRVINWSLGEGIGALRWLRSQTDANGYAYNYFLAFDSTGPERIIVSTEA